VPFRGFFLPDGVDGHAFAGDDVGLVVRAEASGVEVAGDLDRPRTEPTSVPSFALPSVSSSLARYSSEPLQHSAAFA
jgi:hypothetical protein